MKNRQKIKDILISAFKGVFTGAAMVIPGISGGTMALVFGFYDKLVDAVSNIFKSFKKNFLTLLFFALCVGGGFILSSGGMTYLIEKVPLPLFSFFTGAILGGVPVIIRKAKTSSSPIKIYDLLYPVGGAAVMFLLSLMPEGTVSVSAETDITGYLFLLVAGVCLAAAVVLPGVSLSHMMLVLGIYEPLMTAVKNLDIFYLLPIGISVLISTFIIVKFLDKAMKRFPKQTFLTVLGFVLASVIDIAVSYVAPLFGGVWDLLLCLLFGGAGFGLIFLISLKEKN